MFLSSPRASDMRRFFQVAHGLMRLPRSVSGLSCPEADEQRPWVWVGRGRAEAPQCRQETNSRDGGRLIPQPGLSCPAAGGPAHPPPPAPSPVVLPAGAPPQGPSGAIALLLAAPQPLQRPPQAAPPGLTHRPCPGLVGGRGTRHRGVQGGAGAFLPSCPTSVLILAFA